MSGYHTSRCYHTLLGNRQLAGDLVMGRAKISETKIANIKKLKELGLTYRQIGELYNTSGVQVHYWINGRSPKRLRVKSEACELCHRSGVLNHHHWENPSLGVWLCPRCHMAAGVLDEVLGFTEAYFGLKASAQREFANNEKT